jgi:hypothetical protein
MGNPPGKRSVRRHRLPSRRSAPPRINHVLIVMSSIIFAVLTALLLLAMLGASAGVLLENQRNPSRSLWNNFATREALLPLAGWGSLFALDFSVTLVGEHRMAVGFKHLLGTLALLLLYYAVLSTLYLIYRSGERVLVRLPPDARPVKSRAIPFLSRLAFPILFLSSALAAISVLYYDGLSQNLVFIGCIALVAAIVPRSALKRVFR